MTQVVDETYKTPKEMNIQNKNIILKKVIGIKIKKFRNMINQEITLSDCITLVAGHNGTMKSTLIGLFVQNFNSTEKDLFNTSLKTDFSEIFKLSSKYDKEKYEYELLIEDENNKKLSIYAYTKIRSASDPRPRIVTGGASKYDGNLIYDTNYLNLNRLYSIHHTNSVPVETDLDNEEEKFVAKFYASILQKEAYNSIEAVSDKNIKKTFAPTDSNYDYEAISSGEDNLGRIVNSLISFMRISKKNQNNNTFNGILCIDEVEASLHPVAQRRLFDFLYSWSRKYKVQIILTTHSLPLLKHSIENKNCGKEINTYYFSTLFSSEIEVYPNPSYESVYKELTFEYGDDADKMNIPKIDLICEDDLAKKFIQRLVGKQHILNRINFVTFDGTEGFSYTFLIKLSTTASSFIKNTLVVFDSDVSDNALSKIKNQSNILQLPDYEENLPIEKLIVKYLYDKDKSDTIYSNLLDIPKAYLINTLTDKNIYIDNNFEWKTSDVKPFKKWFKDNSSIVNKVFNNFAKNINGRDEFVTNLISKLNIINNRNGYPEITIDNK